jgi:hypothetical protein
MAENNTILIGQRGEPVNNAPAGRVYLWSENGNIFTKDENGNVKSQLPSPFGEDFQESRNSTTVSNASSFYTVHNQITLTDLTPTSKYRIGGTFTWGMSTGTRNIEIIITVNGIEDKRLEMEVKDTGAEIRNLNSTFLYAIVSPSGELDIKIEFKPENSNDLATMYDSHLEVWRVE